MCYTCPLCDAHPDDPFAHGVKSHPVDATRLRGADPYTTAIQLARRVLLGDHGGPGRKRLPSEGSPTSMARLALEQPADPSKPDRARTITAEALALLGLRPRGRVDEDLALIASRAGEAAPPVRALLDELIGRLTAGLIACCTEPSHRYHCPDCGAPLEPVGDYLVCHECGGIGPGAERTMAQWRKREPAPAAELAADLGIRPNKIHEWAYAGRITPAARSAAGRPLWAPMDVLQLMWPDVG